MTTKDKRKAIEKLVNYASENMGNDVLLSQTVDDLFFLITTWEKEAEEQGFLKGFKDCQNMVKRGEHKHCCLKEDQLSSQKGDKP